MESREIIRILQQYGQEEVPFIDNDPSKQMVIERVMALDKGFLIFAAGEKYPARMHARGDKAATVAQFKRLIPVILKGFKGNVFKKVITGLYFYLNYTDYLQWIHFFLSGVYFKNPDRYSQPVREVYRIVQDEKIRDIVCSILEYDSAYRYRFQDVISLLDKRNEPLKEVKRLLGIAIEREESETMKAKWRKMQSLVWLIRFNRKLYHQLKYLIQEIDLKEVSSSVEDTYWQYINYDYNYNGLDFETRKQIYNEQKNS